MSDDHNGFEEPEIRDVEEPLDIPVRLILLLIGVALLVFFIAQNNEETHVEFLWLDGNFPLSILIIATAVLGALIALLGSMIMRRKRRKQREAENT